jgi:hypothetical protein
MRLATATGGSLYTAQEWTEEEEKKAPEEKGGT